MKSLIIIIIFLLEIISLENTKYFFFYFKNCVSMRVNWERKSNIESNIVHVVNLWHSASASVDCTNEAYSLANIYIRV